MCVGCGIHSILHLFLYLPPRTAQHAHLLMPNHRNVCGLWYTFYTASVPQVTSQNCTALPGKAQAIFLLVHTYVYSKCCLTSALPSVRPFPCLRFDFSPLDGSVLGGNSRVCQSYSVHAPPRHVHVLDLDPFH